MPASLIRGLQPETRRKQRKIGIVELLRVSSCVMGMAVPVTSLSCVVFTVESCQYRWSAAVKDAGMSNSEKSELFHVQCEASLAVTDAYRC